MLRKASFFWMLILSIGIESGYAHCLDTDTVIRHFTDLGGWGLPVLSRFEKSSNTLPGFSKSNLGYPVFWLPSSISLGSETGVDDTHECSLKRALMCGHNGLTEH